MFKNEISEQYGQQYFLEEENCSPPCRRTYKIQRESIKILSFIDFTMGRCTRAKTWNLMIQVVTQSIQSLLGDKWETSVKSCGQSTQSIQSLLGDKWETNGTQV